MRPSAVSFGESALTTQSRMRGEARVPRGADPKHAPPRRKGLGAESEEKREPVIAFVNAITDAEIDAAFATRALQHAKLKSRSAAVRVCFRSDTAAQRQAPTIPSGRGTPYRKPYTSGPTR